MRKEFFFKLTESEFPELSAKGGKAQSVERKKREQELPDSWPTWLPALQLFS